MQNLNPEDLRDWLKDDSRAKPVLLDVREAWELERCALDNITWIPMRDVQLRVDELDPDKDIVVICHHGVRSFYVARYLEQQGFTNVYNLSGGVEKWARHIDPNMPTY